MAWDPKRTVHTMLTGHVNPTVMAETKIGFRNTQLNSDVLTSTVGGSMLSHWGWLTHICVSKLTIIGSDFDMRLVGAKPLSEPMLGYC